MIQGTAKKMADDFFAKFTQVVGQPVEAAAPETGVVSASGAVETPEPALQPAPLRRMRTL